MIPLLQQVDERKLRHVVLREQDHDQARRYRERQQELRASLTASVQRALIDEVILAAWFQRWHLFAVSTEDAHLHLIAGWDDRRLPERVQIGVKTSITRRLNHDFGRRRWLGRNGHDKRVRGPEHFVYLREQYLPSHRGWKWDRRVGWFR